MAELIISVSGLRGIVGVNLTPEVAMRYAAAYVADLPPGAIVITRDGRTTGRMLVDAVRAGLMAVGRDVIDADIAATPTTGVLVRRYQAVGGIQVSASHNPPEYNGLKLFGADGAVISAAAGQPVLSRFTRDDSPKWVDYRKLGELRPCDDSLTDHLALVAATVDVERIRDRAFHVLLDSNHGAGSLLGRRLLEQLGCKVTVLGGEPTGRFAHTPEPTAENLADVSARAAALKVDVGFCQDPDADRLALLDETGYYVGEEYTLAVCLDHVLRSRSGPVVTNCSTSRMSQDIAAKHGVPFFRSAVGEANVTAEMRLRGAVFGGEGNGGPIDPRVGYVRDSFVGMALTLDSLAAQNKKLSQVVAELPRYAIHKTKLTLDRQRIPGAVAALKARFSDARADELDGLRLDWNDRWLLVRASNTEPIVRAIAEAPTPAAAQQLCDDALEIMSAAR
ncbi:MAG TPA: phosphoglucosamine mutase [Pirellulaceae bacterium]|nr:phosphoglucosamine mutase [Pirellulaceae bacterium]